MKRSFLLTALFVCALTIAPFATIYADVTYSYTGKNLGPDPGYTFSPYYTTSDSVLGTITLTSALGAGMSLTDITGMITSFSFTDGAQAYTQASSLTVEDFKVATDGSGNIDAWQVAVGANFNYFILSCNGDFSDSDYCSPGNGWGIGGAADEVFFSPAVGINEGTPGTWGLAPEPSSLLLFGSGVLGLAGMIRRRIER